MLLLILDIRSKQSELQRSLTINIAGSSVNTAGVSVNTAVMSVNTGGSKPTVNHPRSISNGYKRGYSQVIRPFNNVAQAHDGNKMLTNEYEEYEVALFPWNGKGRISGKGNQTNGIAGTRDNIITGHAEKKTEPEQEYILIPICTTDPLISQDPKVSEEDAEEKTTEMDEINAAEASNAFEEHLFKRFSPFKNAFTLPPVSNVTSMDDTGIFGNTYDDEDVGAEADLNNMETTINVSPILTTRIDKDHPKDQINGDY
ncbi:hypothetical protein Tco_1107360 [Tanacetum coccineum]